jgi:hypothetical protein
MAVSQKEKGSLLHFCPAPRIGGWGSISVEDGVRKTRHNAVILVLHRQQPAHLGLRHCWAPIWCAFIIFLRAFIIRAFS